MKTLTTSITAPLTTPMARAIGAGMLGLMLASGVQADNHGMKKDIVDTAVGAGQFETLVAAVQAAELVETLKGDGPFTVFAPTDEAFAALPEGTVEDLLKPENQATLQAVLTYHVVPGMIMAEDAMAADSATTVQGQDITITTMDGSVMIDDATVIQADIEASNGVIHVIDGVLMPE
ncbi:fasciclin domain-containing protein [Halomonas saccharevitans]|uniref:Fasciclin domain-containing protein n=1 Tax=Halomonas saccharevitans TaxID=416872 RepID=A0ABU3NCG1_9GAMM|nr:fasciclin domain-containing protein [Halomonas saccharevitans]MDT8878732.1 fasciclin domain-containing protein [Halomonas saccharevitans]